MNNLERIKNVEAAFDTLDVDDTDSHLTAILLSQQGFDNINLQLTSPSVGHIVFVLMNALGDMISKLPKDSEAQTLATFTAVAKIELTPELVKQVNEMKAERNTTVH